MITRTLLLPLVLALVAACTATLDEACDEVGAAGACADGLVCVADPDPVCRAVCEDHGDCPGPRACRTADGCGDEVRACQEKD
jgi:hypothetical protein